MNSPARLYIRLFCIIGSCLYSQDRTYALRNTDSVQGDTLKSSPANASSSSARRSTTSDTLRKYPNQAFGNGEYLRFEVNYEFISVGEAVMRINDTTYHNE